MKRILFFLSSFLFLFIFSVIVSASMIDISWAPSENSGTFVTAGDTKSIPEIDRMYAATGATIQSDFHAKVWQKLFPSTKDPILYQGFQLPTREVVLYSRLSNSGFSLSH